MSYVIINAILIVIIGCVFMMIFNCQRDIVRKVLLWFSLITLGAVFFLWAWGGVFLWFVHTNPWLARPSTVFQIMAHLSQLTLLAQLKFWAFLVFVFIGASLFFVHPLLEYLQPKDHDNAHWATLREIKKFATVSANLNAHRGNFLIGYYHNKFFSVPFINSVLLLAPSREGKGVSTVIPNALLYPGSMIATDIKYELFELTASHRKSMGQDIYFFAPTRRDRKTHCINPLDYVDKDNPSRCISDLQLIAETIVHQESKQDSMWVTEARALALGLLLWNMESRQFNTIGGLNALTKAQDDLAVFLREMINDSIIAKNLITINPVAYMNITNFLNKAEKEQSGVRSTLVAKLSLWDDPVINAATSRSDFDMRDFRRKKMSLYLGFPPNQIERIGPLCGLIVQQFLMAMTEELPKEDEPIKVMALLDEFCNLGFLPKLKSAFSYIPGYNIYLVPVIQNTGQLYDVYKGRDQCDVFFQNTNYKIALRQNTHTDRQFVSQELGTKRVKVKTRSRQSNGAVSTNESHTDKPLLSPKQVGTLPKKKGILITSGHEPVLYKRIVYYKDKQFKSLISPPPDIKPITPLPISINVDVPETAIEITPSQDITNIDHFVEDSTNNKGSVTAHDHEERPIHPNCVDTFSSSPYFDADTLDRLAADYDKQTQES